MYYMTKFLTNLPKTKYTIYGPANSNIDVRYIQPTVSTSTMCDYRLSNCYVSIIKISKSKA